jgi:hypothetical protein
MLEMLGNGFNKAKRYGEALAFFERAIKVSGSTPDVGFPYMAYEGESAQPSLSDGGSSYSEHGCDHLRTAPPLRYWSGLAGQYDRGPLEKVPVAL